MSNPEQPMSQEQAEEFRARSAEAAERYLAGDLSAPIQEGVVHRPHKPKEGKWRGDSNVNKLYDDRDNVADAFFKDKTITLDSAEALRKESRAAEEVIIEEKNSQPQVNDTQDYNDHDANLTTLDVGTGRVDDETITLEGYRKGKTVVKPFDREKSITSTDPTDPRLLNNRSGKHYADRARN